ncbi:MAG: glycosyltransferase [Lentimicrobiaceae bacterium]|nr:glycosyltransferase [Lentimicrobiaceae bacterium]MCB9023065.1 glycosyltransferase [Lentimicrobiaceae bacterium]
MGEKKLNAYIYPNTKIRVNKELYNPYIDDLVQAFGNYFHFLNAGDKTNKGILNMLFYFRRTDILFLNWIENLPDKRFGTLQSALFILLLYAYKLSGKKVIWTVHNKESHNNRGQFMKNLFFRLLPLKTDKMITHSTEGITYIETIAPGMGHKVMYFPHPVKNRMNLKKNNQPTIDILIWGTIAEHKAIDKFLAYLYEQKLENKYAIHIIGKIYSPDYADVIMKYANDKIIIENRFATQSELSELINQSSIILFTYESKYVLSSGVLMDTIAQGGFSVGPCTGAFSDLEKEGIVKTFSSYPELISIINEKTNAPSVSNDIFTSFITRYSWDNFARAFHHHLNSPNAISSKKKP